MLKDTILNLLNEQVNLEYYSSNLYLQMSSWFSYHGLDGCAQFMSEHAMEEREHMTRLFNYITETGGYVKLGQIPAPKTEWESHAEIFEDTLEHECLITSKINNLAKAAFDQADFSTFNFLQWYVGEQHEEEQLFRSILDKVKLLGDDKKGLYFIDKEVGALAKGEAPAAEPQ